MQLPLEAQEAWPSLSTHLLKDVCWLPFNIWKFHDISDQEVREVTREVLLSAVSQLSLEGKDQDVSCLFWSSNPHFPLNTQKNDFISLKILTFV